MQKQAGFTITELMITIAIVAILMSIAIPSYIGKLPAKRMQALLLLDELERRVFGALGNLLRDRLGGGRAEAGK